MEFHTGTTMWKHKKTGKIYYVILQDVIECTNGREDIKYVVYMSAHNGMKFCRKAEEFYQKFEKM